MFCNKTVSLLRQNQLQKSPSTVNVRHSNEPIPFTSMMLQYKDKCIFMHDPHMSANNNNNNTIIILCGCMSTYLHSTVFNYVLIIVCKINTIMHIISTCKWTYINVLDVCMGASKAPPVV